MERLQEALQKARQKRNENDPGHESISGKPGRPQSADVLWKNLTAFQPDAAHLERNRIVTGHANKVSASFDILRTKIMLTMQKNNWKRIAITSPTVGCGASTTACNLALGFGRQPDVRTCLFEFDLRKPSIADKLGLPDGADIADMLTGKVPYADQGLRYKDNVAISAARQRNADPTAIMVNRDTHQTLEQIEKTYDPDITIFDLPPLLSSDNARAFLKQVACALMVALAERSTVTEVDECEREIAEQCNVIGVVLNHCRHIDGA